MCQSFKSENLYTGSLTEQFLLCSAIFSFQALELYTFMIKIQCSM